MFPDILRANLLDRRSYRPIAATWMATRVLALLWIALLPRLLDDVEIYSDWLPLLRENTFPIGDPKWQYPPGAGVLLVAPDYLHVNYAVAFAALCIVFDLAIMMALFIAHSRRTHPDTFGLWVWAIAGLVVGPIMFTRFDIVPTFFAVACVLLVARPAWAGISAGVGFMLKIWPVMMLLALPRKRTWRSVLCFVVAVLVLLVLIALPFDGSLSFLSNQRARGLQVESTGALPYWIFAILGGQVSYALQYGSMQIDMAGAELVGTAIALIGLVLLAVIAWWRLNGRLDRVTAGDVAIALVLVMVASSRVYSPQFNVWLIGVAAAATISSQSRMRQVAVILVGVAVVTQFVYPLYPSNFTGGEAWIVLIQSARIVGLLYATFLAVREIAFPQRSAQSETADAAATLRESTPADMGMRTTISAD